MKYPFIAAALFLAGCAHVGKQATRAPSPNAAAADQVIPVGSTATLTGSASPAYPAEYEEYYVGMIPDDDDPNFAYRPGDLIVRTRPARSTGHPSHFPAGEGATPAVHTTVLA